MFQYMIVDFGSEDIPESLKKVYSTAIIESETRYATLKGLSGSFKIVSAQHKHLEGVKLFADLTLEEIK